MQPKSELSDSIDILIDSEIVPQESIASIIIAIIEHLLYYRNQIPMLFCSFKSFVSRLNESDDTDWDTFLFNKQKNLAKKTLQNINNLCQNVLEECKKSNVTSARILFGPTPLTPREAFTIKFPKSSDEHFTSNHFKSIESTVRHILMSLMMSDKFYRIFSNNLPTTNMFLELEETVSTANCDKNFQLKDYNELPPKCRSIEIRIIHKSPPQLELLQCCKNIRVFDAEKISMPEHFDEDVQSSVGICVEEKSETFWKEANGVIKGFKDIIIKGRSIWH